MRRGRRERLTSRRAREADVSVGVGGEHEPAKHLLPLHAPLGAGRSRAAARTTAHAASLCRQVLWSLPLALGLEARGAVAAWCAAAPTRQASASLLGLIAQSGRLAPPLSRAAGHSLEPLATCGCVCSRLLFTAYTEVQFQALDSVSPVSHAVGNTMRRVPASRPAPPPD